MHTLEHIYMVSSEVTNIPDYVNNGYVDEVEMYNYNSNSRRREPKQDWMKNITAGDRFLPQFYRNYLETAKRSFNQTGGVHVLQVTLGCEWDEDTDESEGWFQAGYDGEDILSLDMKTWTWTAAKPQAVPTKDMLDQNKAQLDYAKYFFTEECPQNLKRFVNYGRKVLMRRELPEVFLLQKTPSSPVSCLATGFYPNRAVLFWRKDGQEIHQDVAHGELLPNHDGTFQMTVDLDVDVTADVEGKYECVFQLSGVKEDMVTKLERRSILSNASREDKWSITVVAVLVVAVLIGAVLVVAVIVIIVKRLKNRQVNYDPAARDGGIEL
nr:major histocompatibility complex class I-related gene protein-like isoform X2 [Doryrhamphus excisus]